MEKSILELAKEIAERKTKGNNRANISFDRKAGDSNSILEIAKKIERSKRIKNQ